MISLYNFDGNHNNWIKKYIMDVSANLIEEASNDQPQLIITDLCDDVLIKIFSYLDIHDKCLIIPQVCRQFTAVLSLCLPKQIDTNELRDTKWNKAKTSVLFRKIGHCFRSVSISYCYDATDAGRYLNWMLTEIRKNCVNILNLRIQQEAHMNHVADLPKTIRKIELDYFQGSSLNLGYLNNLDTLHLGVYNIPSASNWIKVENRLKEVELTLNLEVIPNNISTIDNLMSSISDNFSVKLNIYDEVGYNPYIILDPLPRLSNVTSFSIIGYTVDNEDLNKIMQNFAEKNTLVELHIGCLTCNSHAPPVITLKTIDSLLRCSSLEMIECNYNCYINSMIVGYMKRLKLKNIRMQYGFAELTQHDKKLSVEMFKDLIEFVHVFVAPTEDVYPEYLLSYQPKDRFLNLTFKIECKKLWKLFSSVYLQDAPQLLWVTREYLYVYIDART